MLWSRSLKKFKPDMPRAVNKKNVQEKIYEGTPEMDEYGTVTKFAVTAGPGVPVKILTCLGGIRHDIQANVTVSYKSKVMQKTTFENSPVFDPDIVSKIKQE
ncbi:hypothetical protein NDU88_004615 [Pleurodeles waltl]|uniref:Uncharacterized protein n=1 Tax=Pleurodeles waltl TaxID=8319 RepID=A0AAV7PD12_PLEWA|nr:hypothetical protein NDU88_004615 [Pleurodeles waltl]